MPTRRAVANGNWSATSTWNGGVVPTDGDTVYSNGFNITLDVDVLIGGANNPIVNTGSLVSGQWYEIVNVGGQNWTTLGAASNTTGTIFQSTGTGTAGNLGTARALATLTTATNTAAGATTGGGSFVMSTVRQITTDLRAGSTSCLNFTATTGTFSVQNLNVVGGGATSSHAFLKNGSADCQFSACSFSTLGGSGGFAVNNLTNSGALSISNSAFTGAGNSSGAVVNNGSITISISGSTINGSVSPPLVTNSGAFSISSSTILATAGSAINIVSSTNGLTLTGCTITAGTGSGATIINGSISPVTATTCTFTASATANAFSNTSNSADVRLSGDFLDHWSGWRAVNGAKWRLGTTPSAARTRYALAGTTDSYVEMFTADNATFGQPAISNVRAGVVYGGGILTGTCAVPAAGSVALGVPVDNTTGTAILTQANVQSAVWNTLTSSLTTAGSIGERLKNAATVATTGEQLATALTAP